MKILGKALFMPKENFKNLGNLQRETVNIKGVDNNQDYNLS